MPTPEEIKALVLLALEKSLWQAGEVHIDSLPEEQKALASFWPEYFDPARGAEKCTHCGAFFVPTPEVYSYNCPQCGKPCEAAPDWYKESEDWQPK